MTEGPKYDRRLAATDLGREYIPQIYDMVIAGHSLADICGWLDSLHLWQKRDPQTERTVRELMPVLSLCDQVDLWRYGRSAGLAVL